MFEFKKRGKGKFTNRLGLKEMYVFYKENTENPVDYKTFSKVIKESNKLIVKKIVWDSEEFRCFNIGTFRIRKKERHLLDRKPNRWPLNYQETKKLGYKVFYEQEYSNVWYWCKIHAKFKRKKLWAFVACRTAKRDVAKASNQNIPYFR